MNDREILDMFGRGDPRAREEAEALYGYDCLKIALNVLDHQRQAEACVTRAMEIAAERAHADDPPSLKLYLLRSTRELAIGLFRGQKDAKRAEGCQAGGQHVLAGAGRAERVLSRQGGSFRL